MAITDNLIHWWDNPQGAATAVDQVGNWDLTHNGTPAQAIGDGPYGQNVTGYTVSSDYHQLASHTPPFTGDFTVSCWVKLTGSNGPTSIAQIVSTPWLQIRYTHINDAFYPVVQGNSGTHLCLGSTAVAIDNTQWVFVVVTHDQSGTPVTRLYLDTIQDGTQSAPLTPYTTDGVLRLGQKWDSALNAGRMLGKLAMVGMWDRILASNEISGLYNSGNGMQYSDLVRSQQTIRHAVRSGTKSTIRSVIRG